jgi:radical SAM protein with 4Fe4S-binding SPASM domain
MQHEERERLMRAPRPRRGLPLLESTASHARNVSLSVEARAIDHRARPVHAVWELTLACDLSCRHCGSRAGRSRPDELSVDEALALVPQLAELGVREVTLIGGEAYLYPGFAQVARAVREHGMSCAMVTGGRGLQRERALAARDAGVESVSVSLDGDEATHDRLRGVAGSYRAARAALDTCREVGLAVALNTQVNRLNLDALDHLCDVAIAHGCHGWQLMLTVPSGRAADEPEILLQPSDLLDLFPRLARTQARCAAHGLKFLPGNNVGYFGPFEQQLRGSLRCGTDMSCSAGKLVIGIEANGDVKGCPSLPTRGWVGGNVRDHALRAIWERAEALRFTRDRNGSELWGYCASCYYASECKAGCTWTATSLFGRPGNNPYCHHRALEHARRGQRERVVPRSAAPGEAFDYGLWELVVEPLCATDATAEPEEQAP